MGEVLTFRFDDISVNSSMEQVNDIAFYLKTRFPDCRIIYGISPIVCDMTEHTNNNPQRVFPKLWSAFSNYQIFYTSNKIGIPETPEWIERAAHGLLHIDHRLLDRECQEMSIMTSCHLVDSKIFIPPFNKWNKNTIDICDIRRITLIRFEEGWKSMEHEPYDPEHKLWYLHHWAFGLDKVKNWLNKNDEF